MPLAAPPAPGDRVCYKVKCTDAKPTLANITDQFGNRSVEKVGRCGAKPCWSTTLKKHQYSDHAGSSDGLTGIKLQSSHPRASISVMGKGGNLPPLGLPLAPDPTLVVQLRASNGGCWGATFSAPSQSSAERFKAKSE